MSNSINHDTLLFDDGYDHISSTRTYSACPMYIRREGSMASWSFPESLQNKIRNEQDPDWKEIDIPEPTEEDKAALEQYKKDREPVDPEQMYLQNLRNGVYTYEKYKMLVEHGIQDEPEPEGKEKEQQDRIKSLYEREHYNITKELDNSTHYVPYIFFLRDKKCSKDCYQACPHYKCSCDNSRSSLCSSAACKFRYAKENAPSESKLKDGLEIMDIPSTMLETIEKRQMDNERKKKKYIKQRDSMTDFYRRNNNSNNIVYINQPVQAVGNTNMNIEYQRQDTHTPLQQANTMPVNTPVNMNMPMNMNISANRAVLERNMMNTINMLKRVVPMNMPRAIPLAIRTPGTSANNQAAFLNTQYGAFNINNITVSNKTSAHDESTSSTETPMEMDHDSDTSSKSERKDTTDTSPDIPVNESMKEFMDSNINAEMTTVQGLGEEPTIRKRKMRD